MSCELVLARARRGAPVYSQWLCVVACAFVLVAGSGLLLGGPAHALDAIVVKPGDDRIEVSAKGEFYEARGDRFQVETVAAENGVAGRITVAAQANGTNPNWLVFALTNPSRRRIERWLTADRYEIVGSGIVWPDLDARRIEAVTPSIGFLPELIKSDRADVYRITLEPGQTITFVAELSSKRAGRVFLWKPLAYELKVRERQLFNGVLLGLTGLLAIFLTAIFGANHKIIFPTAALVAWCVLGYLCIEFGFFHKLFKLNVEDTAVYRAAGEASIAASLVLFLYTFLRLGLANSLIRMLFGVWILAQLALIAVAVIDPRLAATFARMSFGLIGVVGAAATLYLAFRGQDRAISLIPTWLLFLVWIFTAAVTLTGRMSGEVAVAGLVAGLVLVVLLIGFTVTQFVFRSFQPFHGTPAGEQQLQALAVHGAGAATWEWNDRRNEVRVSPHVEALLGLRAGELSVKVDSFVDHIKPSDRDRFKLMLWSVQERGGGQIRVDFRLRASDNSYRWFDLDAASVDTADRRSIRCVGLLRDITDVKRSHERLLHDAVHCSLTRLPNRELFVDRLSVAMQRAMTDGEIRPTVLLIDIDKFKSVNSSMGLVVGDSLLLTIARRLEHYLGPQDTLARTGGDQFAILLMSQLNPTDLAALAERIRRSLRTPITIAGREVRLTGSIGIAIYDGEEETHLDLLKEAEVAMYRAKRAGADRIEIFTPEMRSEPDDRVAIESELRAALEKNELTVLFQPIVYLPTEELAGFEALVRWKHPTRGLLTPDAFIPVAEESDLISQLGSYVLKKSVAALVQWQKILPRSDAPLFASVNISSRQLMSVGLAQEVKKICGQSRIRPGSLRLEITESLVMLNPEQAVERMEQIRAAGAELALDDFGTGYSSLKYLQRFPVDTIKLDRTFVQESDEQESAGSAIVRSMVALAHELGKSVVAEGVEDPNDAAVLRSIGCEFAQGYYYGEAMEHAEAIELLRVIRKSESKLKAQGFFRPKPKKAKDKTKAAKGERKSGERRPESVQEAPRAGNDAAGKTTRTPSSPAPTGSAHGANGAALAGKPGNSVPPQVPRSGKSAPAAKPGSAVANPPPQPVPPLPPGTASVAAKTPNRGGAPNKNAVSNNGAERRVPPNIPTAAPGNSGVNGAGTGGPRAGVPTNPNAAQPPAVPAPRPSGAKPGPGQASSPPPPLPSSRAWGVPPVPPAGSAGSAPGTNGPAPPPVPSAEGTPGKGRPGEPPHGPPAQPPPRADNGLGALLGGLPPLPVDAVLDVDKVAHDANGAELKNGSVDDTGAEDQTGDPNTHTGGDAPDLSSLPPGIAASLARLAGSTSGGSAEGQPRRLGDGGRVARPAGKKSRTGKRDKS